MFQSLESLPKYNFWLFQNLLFLKILISQIHAILSEFSVDNENHSRHFDLKKVLMQEIRS